MNAAGGGLCVCCHYLICTEVQLLRVCACLAGCAPGWLPAAGKPLCNPLLCAAAAAWTYTCLHSSRVQGIRVAHRSKMVYGSRGRSGCLPSGAWNSFARLASSAPHKGHARQPRPSSKATSSSSTGGAEALPQHVICQPVVKQTCRLVKGAPAQELWWASARVSMSSSTASTYCTVSSFVTLRSTVRKASTCAGPSCAGQELHITHPIILSLSLHEEEGVYVAPPRGLRALMFRARQKVFADSPYAKSGKISYLCQQLFLLGLAALVIAADEAQSGSESRRAVR